MKFVISFFFCVNAIASPIFIHHEGNPIEAQMIKDILMKDYQIPEELISVTRKECAEIKETGKLNLCLKNNGDLLVVSVDRNFINESLKVFQAP